MNCIKCEHEIEENSKFCNKCGEQQTKTEVLVKKTVVEPTKEQENEPLVENQEVDVVTESDELIVETEEISVDEVLEETVEEPQEISEEVVSEITLETVEEVSEIIEEQDVIEATVENVNDEENGSVVVACEVSNEAEIDEKTKKIPKKTVIISLVLAICLAGVTGVYFTYFKPINDAIKQAEVCVAIGSYNEAIELYFEAIDNGSKSSKVTNNIDVLTAYIATENALNDNNYVMAKEISETVLLKYHDSVICYQFDTLINTVTEKYESDLELNDMLSLISQTADADEFESAFTQIENIDLTNLSDDQVARVHAMTASVVDKQRTLIFAETKILFAEKLLEVESVTRIEIETDDILTLIETESQKIELNDEFIQELFTFIREFEGETSANSYQTEYNMYYVASMDIAHESAQGIDNELIERLTYMTVLSQLVEDKAYILFESYFG